MKIIRNGNIRKVRKLALFKCDVCGCVWTEEGAEVHMEDCGYNYDVRPVSKCPFTECTNEFCVWGDLVPPEIEIQNYLEERGIIPDEE